MNTDKEIEILSQQVAALEYTLFTLIAWSARDLGEKRIEQLVSIYKDKSHNEWDDLGEK